MEGVKLLELRPAKRDWGEERKRRASLTLLDGQAEKGIWALLKLATSLLLPLRRPVEGLPLQGRREREGEEWTNWRHKRAVGCSRESEAEEEVSEQVGRMEVSKLKRPAREQARRVHERRP